ncbi:HIT domain-containing protein [Luteipulveratus mongoliensis]|uniref:HIT family hydrolase n=1 Tax=Luteipulveratus mongoliensis TaxID=571913 RepID=A0A0K1JK60_9MICO|nr:HIT domain-containing protein [Luteipulveratus mongoliensis]AKU17091.1 HIT family hydrolase [Luteipulveratus mongoliensis]
MTGYSGDDFYCDVAIPRREPLRVVFEDDAVLAFEHTRPFWPVHIVVVPKRHVDSLLTLEGDDTLAGSMLRAVQRVAADVLRDHGAASVTTNLGDYQDSKHLHVHVHAGTSRAERI